MKTDYLKELKALLDNYEMSETEKSDIVNDYSEMYDNWVAYGMVDEEVEEKLGKPRSIIRDLVEGYRKVGSSKSEGKKSNAKIIAITPFVALIIFFIIGFGYDGWLYGWMAFLLIPTTAIFLEMKSDSHRLTALMPFISLISFFILGFVFTLWHPGWIVFLLIPIVAIITERKSIGFLNTFVALSPLLITAAYLYIGFEYNLWTPGWTLFLIIPALGVLNEKKVSKILLWELVILGGVAGYLYVGYAMDEWNYALLAFVPLVLVAALQDIKGFLNMPMPYRILTLTVGLTYIGLGLLTGMWGYFWLVFLAIPVYAIITEADKRSKLIALMPFISLFIFFTLGWFFNLWAFSWMAFLLIPMVAIIKEA